MNLFWPATVLAPRTQMIKKPHCCALGVGGDEVIHALGRDQPVAREQVVQSVLRGE